jgi:transketolase
LALDAANALSAEGVELAILHLPTIKPLDRAAIVAAMAAVPIVVAVEEHSIIGGLGSAVAEIIAEEGFSPPKRFKRIGIPDVFPDAYGSQASLMARYGITADAVVQAVREPVRLKPDATGAHAWRPRSWSS